MGRVSLGRGRLCIVAECERPHLAGGYCQPHYDSLRRNGSLGYGLCVGWWSEFTANIVPWVGDRALYDGVVPDRPVIAMSGQTSIARAYNAILDAYQRYELDAVMLMHTDLEITDPAAEEKVLAALGEPGVALVGVAGGGGGHGTAWWNDQPIGHQMLDSGPLDFGTREGPAEMLEGSLLAFSPWAVEHLRFDETQPGFHGYDDICLQLRPEGKRCWVADIDTHHHTTVGRFRSAQSAADWATAHGRSLAKRSGSGREPDE